MALVDTVKAYLNQENPAAHILQTLNSGLKAAEIAHHTGNHSSDRLSSGERDIALQLEDEAALDRLLARTRENLEGNGVDIFDATVNQWRTENAARIARLQKSTETPQ